MGARGDRVTCEFMGPIVACGVTGTGIGPMHGEGAAPLAASMDSPQGSHTITGGQRGKPRLNPLAEIIHFTTLRPLGDAGLRAGDWCLDLGGGHPMVGSGHGPNCRAALRWAESTAALLDRRPS